VKIKLLNLFQAVFFISFLFLFLNCSGDSEQTNPQVVEPIKEDSNVDLPVVIPPVVQEPNNGCITGKLYNKKNGIVLLDVVQYYRDDLLIYNFFGDDLYAEGYFSIRTVDNHMIVDNFKVYSLK